MVKVSLKNPAGVLFALYLSCVGKQFLVIINRLIN